MPQNLALGRKLINKATRRSVFRIFADEPRRRPALRATGRRDFPQRNAAETSVHRLGQIGKAAGLDPSGEGSRAVSAVPAAPHVFWRRRSPPVRERRRDRYTRSESDGGRENQSGAFAQRRGKRPLPRPPRNGGPAASPRRREPTNLVSCAASWRASGCSKTFLRAILHTLNYDEHRVTRNRRTRALLTVHSVPGSTQDGATGAAWPGLRCVRAIAVDAAAGAKHARTPAPFRLMRGAESAVAPSRATACISELERYGRNLYHQQPTYEFFWYITQFRQKKNVREMPL